MRPGDPQLSRRNVLSVALLGSGPGSPPSIGPFFSRSARRLGWDLVGVAGSDSSAPGLVEARKNGLNVFSDVQGLLHLSGLDLLVVCNPSPDLLARLDRDRPERIGLMDFHAAMQLLDRDAKSGPDGIPEPKALLNRLSDPICIIGPGYEIQLVNPAFAALFAGPGKPGVTGRTCYDVFHDRSTPCAAHECPLEQGPASTGGTGFREYQHRDHGVERHFEAAFRPIPGPTGKAVRFLVSMRDVTARKGLETELERSRTRYRQLFEHAREGIALVEPHGRIQECNPSLCHMLGFPRNELLARNVWELARDVSRTILRNHLQDLQLMGSVAVEMDFIRRGDRPLPVETDIIWLPDEDVFLLMIRDISVRKRLEASRKLYSETLEAQVEERTRELRESQQQTMRQKQYAEGIIQGTPLAVLVLDRAHRITFWNRACESLTGFAGEEMLGTNRQWEPFYSEPRPTLADLIIDDDREAIQRLYAPYKLRKSPFVEGAWEAEAFFPHLGEEGAHIFFTAAPIRDEQGEIQGAIVTFQDVSERVEMTREIERREAFVQNLVHNSIDGIIATNPEGTIIIFNRGASRILGYEPEEIVGRLSYQDILPKGTTRNVLRAFYGDRYGPPGKLIHMESELLNQDEEAIPVRLSGTLLYEDGKETGSVVFVQDLREIQRLQREKQQAERMAAVGRTVAGLAHYIKNILNGLRGGGYVINSAIEKGDLSLIAQGWNMVERNVDQISTIVLDMLTYSTDRNPRYEEVDPNELVEEVLKLVEERAKAANVQLQKDLTPGLPRVAMDRTGIHRALLNLVSNAIDACTLEGIMESNGIVRVRTDRPEGWGVRFEVRDNGTGIQQETQEKLFSDFFTTKGYKGTGLGLPVTQKVVNEHGGELTFESEPDQGTTFTLLLPDRNQARQTG